MAGLPDSLHCIAPDLMGLGDTMAPPDEDVSLLSQAEMIATFLKARNVGKVALVGHDHGGGCAQIVAVRYPLMVSHLILVDSVGFDSWPVPHVRARAWLARHVPRIASSPLLMEIFWRSRFGLRQALRNSSVMTPEALEEYIRPLTASPEKREAFRRYLLACDSRDTMDIVEDLKRLPIPTMVVWGSHDRSLPLSLGRRLYREIPGARRFEVIHSAGHLVPEEKPEALASLIREFLHVQ